MTLHTTAICRATYHESMKIHETGNRLAYIISQLRQRPRYGHICIIEVDVERLTMLVQRQLADSPFHGDRRVAEHADPAIYLMTMTTNDDDLYRQSNDCRGCSLLAITQSSKQNVEGHVFRKF